MVAGGGDLDLRVLRDRLDWYAAVPGGALHTECAKGSYRFGFEGNREVQAVHQIHVL
jgi:hypothetical protein